MKTLRTIHRGLIFSVLAVVSLVALRPGVAALAGAPGRPAVAITITDSSIIAPTTFPAGYTAMTITNAGSMPHEATVLRFSPGATVDQVLAASERQTSSDDPADFIALTQLAQFAGGAWMIEPDASISVTLNLTPGSYAVGDGEHLAEGLFAGFTVTGPASDVAPPRSDVTIIQRDFAFEVPPAIPAGRTTLEVRNIGAQSHDANLFKLDPGYTLQDVLASIRDAAGPPAFVHPATSPSALAPGLTEWVTLDLTPGNYMLICLIHDPNTGLPHAAEGMITSLVVR